MDTEARPAEGFISHPTSPNPRPGGGGMFPGSPEKAPHNESASHPNAGEPPAFHGSVFPNAHHFTLTGGNFRTMTNNYHTNTNHYTLPPVPSDFRMIPLCDIDLEQEIHPTRASGIVRRQRMKRSVRCLYSAKLGGQATIVAMYQGDGAEEEWGRDIAKHLSVRHPNFFQMYGAASVGNVHATLFHGDLIPFEAFVNLNRHSHSSTVNIYANCRMEFTEASLFVHSITKKTLAAWDCTRWIRPANGSLCVDFVSPSNDLYFQSGIPGVCSTKAPHTAETVDCMELKQYHEICRWDLSEYRRCPVLLTAVSLGSVVDRRSGDRDQDDVEVASLSYTPFRWGAWSTHRGAAGHVMDDGWTRFNCGEIVGDTIQLHVQAKHSVGHAWLCQANHIFERLQTSSNFKDYAIVHHIHFELKISGTRMVTHPGFLFLCPKKHCRTGSSSFFWPEYPAYWSPDAAGVEVLSTDEAAERGFPSIQRKMYTSLQSWEGSVYDGLRQFHLSKGFDPSSQDIARYLRYPLFQVAGEPFIQLEDTHPEAKHPGASSLDHRGVKQTLLKASIYRRIVPDDLMPFNHLVELYCHSPVLVVYIYAYCGNELWSLRDYNYSKSIGHAMAFVDFTVSIRTSTGLLFADESTAYLPLETYFPTYFEQLELPALNSLHAPDIESFVIDSLTLDQYHQICSFNLGRSRRIFVSPAATVITSAVLCCQASSQLHEPIHIASTPGVEEPLGPRWCGPCGKTKGDVMENGWTRCHCSDALLSETFSLSQSRVYGCLSWLCQANYVFTRLQITSNLENYGRVEGLDFWVEISVTTESTRAGYLFLCPPRDFQIGPFSYRWPACAAYWTLDPTGIERLSAEEATRLGFPAIALQTEIKLGCRDASVYAGLRKFHEAKGFDPDSQDVARHLGYPLVELTWGPVTDELSGFWADDEDWNLGFADPDLEGCDEVEPYADEKSKPIEIDGNESWAVGGREMYGEAQAVSSTFNFIISVQLALIFLACLAAALFNGGAWR